MTQLQPTLSLTQAPSTPNPPYSHAGTIGFVSSLVFVRRIYQAIKCD